jgi:hypothetical protein
MNNRIRIITAFIAATIVAPAAFAVGKSEGHLAATAIDAIAAPAASTIAGAKIAAEATGSSNIAAIVSADKAAIAPTPATAAPHDAAAGFYIHTQRIPAATIKQTVINYGAGAISFVPPAAQHSMPSIMLAGMPDKPAALKLTRAVSDLYRRDGKPFIASAMCVSPEGHRYMYSFTYTPKAKDRHAIWQNVNGESVTKMIADKCPTSDLIVSINPAK